MPAISQPRVALFVTCLVDLFRPSVGFAAVKLLEDAGCRVEVPRGQTCCGQPAYNQGDRADSIADRAPHHRRVRRLRLRRGAVGLLRRHAQEALSRAVRRRPRPTASARAIWPARTFELISFLVDVLRRRGGRGRACRCAPPTTTPARACASSASSSSRAGCSRACAGSSSPSCPTPRSAAASAARSASNIRRSRPRWSTTRPPTSRRPAPTCVLAGDLGCLMNIAGRLKRLGSQVEARHVAEVLAGELDEPPIAAPR